MGDLVERTEWGRLITAMATPMDASLAVDYAQAARLARHLVDTGSTAILVGGTTGESPTLTDDEKSRLLETVLEAVGDRVPVLAGTGNYCTAESVEATRRAERSGAHGVMLVAPYYNKPPQVGLYRHFRTVAEATSLPVMIYNIPGRTGVNISPETMARLSEVENIVALKEAGGSADQAAEMVRAVRGRMRVYSGDDSLTLPMMAVGAYGVVSVASHVTGRDVRAMVEDFAAGRAAEATAIHHRLLPLFRALFVTTNPIPLKAALRLIGLDAGGPRLPLVEATEAEIAVLRRAMAEAGVAVSA